MDEDTPDHGFYCKLRDRIGIEKLIELFNEIVKVLEKKSYIGNAFHFVDASSLLSKIDLWEARDKAIADKENKETDNETGTPKMNNINVPKYSSDPAARFGCKGNKNLGLAIYQRLICIKSTKSLFGNSRIIRFAAVSRKIQTITAIIL